MKCEHCEIENRDIDSTLCIACDVDINNKFKVEQKEKEASWAKTHKCRTCKKGLSLNRYFSCEACVKQETVDDWDSFDDHDFGFGDSPGILLAKKRDEQATEMFLRCNQCEKKKPRTSFNFMSRKKSGRSGNCRDCHKKRLKKVNELKRHAS